MNDKNLHDENGPLTPLCMEMYELILSAVEKGIPLNEIPRPDNERKFTY